VVALVQDSFNIVGMASDGRTALAAVLKLEPDLVVLDISMAGLNGIEGARERKCRGNKTKIVFLTVHEDSDIIATCLSVGALGYVLKALMDSDLIPAMNEALAGRVFVSRLSSEEKTDQTDIEDPQSQLQTWRFGLPSRTVTFDGYI